MWLIFTYDLQHMIELLLVWQVKNDNDAESDSVTACNNFCCLRDQLLRLESVLIVLWQTVHLPVNPCVAFYVHTLSACCNILGDTAQHCARVQVLCKRCVFCWRFRAPCVYVDYSALWQKTDLCNIIASLSMQHFLYLGFTMTSARENNSSLF